MYQTTTFTSQIGIDYAHIHIDVFDIHSKMLEEAAKNNRDAINIEHTDITDECLHFYNNASKIKKITIKPDSKTKYILCKNNSKLNCNTQITSCLYLYTIPENPLFGNLNNMSMKDVQKRIEYIIDYLQKIGIEVSHTLKFQKIEINFTYSPQDYSYAQLENLLYPSISPDDNSTIHLTGIISEQEQPVLAKNASSKSCALKYYNKAYEINTTSNTSVKILNDIVRTEVIIKNETVISKYLNNKKNPLNITQFEIEKAFVQIIDKKVRRKIQKHTKATLQEIKKYAREINNDKKYIEKLYNFIISHDLANPYNHFIYDYEMLIPIVKKIKKEESDSQIAMLLHDTFCANEYTRSNYTQYNTIILSDYFNRLLQHHNQNINTIFYEKN